MKRLLFLLCMSLPFTANADIIVTRYDGNIEDVKVVSINTENVLYTQNGQAKSIQSSDVDGVLYDNGRYVTPPSASQVQKQPTTEMNNDSWDDERPQSVNENSVYTTKDAQRLQRAEERKKKRACWIYAASAYQSFYDEAYNKALQQGLSGAQAKRQAGNEAWSAVTKMATECINRKSTSAETNSEPTSSDSGDNW